MFIIQNNEAGRGGRSWTSILGKVSEIKVNKKLKALILTVTMALSITTVWAVGNDMFLNIEKFQDMALKNTRQSKIDELQIESKKNALEEAEKDAKFLSPSTTRNQKYDNEIQKKLILLRQKQTLNI